MQHPVDLVPAPVLLPPLLSHILPSGAHLAATKEGVLWVRAGGEARAGALRSAANGYIPSMRVFTHSFADSPANISVLFDAEGVGELHAAAEGEAELLLFQACHAAIRLPETRVYPYVRRAPRDVALEWGGGALHISAGESLLTLLPESATQDDDAAQSPAEFLHSVLSTLPAELAERAAALKSRVGREEALQDPIFAGLRERSSERRVRRAASVVRICEEERGAAMRSAHHVPLSAAATAATRFL